eukprot:TRINITY_DN8174_c0_g1_i1.p1 TRINITY_DN8174_c0_g1~~TRINITY_DN8174_c0_g1_i1.p1  ORF type:complete len:458 (-),score=103.17 TRINITY_DN8174_c0_g1_i1:9-1382(-)
MEKDKSLFIGLSLSGILSFYYLCMCGKRSDDTVLSKLKQRRDQVISSSLSLSYSDDPLYIVRGEEQFLIDYQGRYYLDAVNNICHLGHCHPTVVKAMCDQASVLNTNTRYLHENIVDLSERLGSLSPGELSVCFFVNSGSEANDLALRIARTFTGRSDVVSLQNGYHGATQSVLDISPYKYQGKGGYTPPSHSHFIPSPDPYRDPNSAAGSIVELESLLLELEKDGSPIAAFIGEAIMGCAGQVVLPEGYLKRIFDIVRSFGGVCIADEVQIGFGRIGTHYWGYEAEGVIPDIVTLGKPFGNGYPLAGVITTPEIARAFASTGMEYFSSFGGSPVSCAVGLAVLDVIEKEKLQENALVVGNYLMSKLKLLQEEVSIIGEVRGRGLFIGIELVQDKTSKKPNPDATTFISKQMKHFGVLVGTDGPYHSVIKIKPPMIFSFEDADSLVESLSKSISLWK